MKHITREKSQCDPHSSNNTDEEKKAILRKLNQLQRRAEEVVSSIRIVDATFQDMGFIIPSTVNFPQSSTAPSNGIRNTQMMSSSHELLSFRGRIKAEELFLFMDRDNDYLLNYEDFRAAKAFSSSCSIVQESQFRTWETWRLFMFDCGLNTPRNPIIISSDSEQVQDNGGGIIMDQFVRYCRMVESKQPISIILKALHLGYLPKSQLFWQQCKRICDEVVSLRVDRRPPNTHGDVGSESDDVFNFEDVSFIVNNLNFGFTKPEIADFMLHRARVHRLQKEMLRSIFSRRMLSQQDFSFELEDRSGTNRIALQLSKEEQCLGDVSVEVFTTIKREHLLPWLLACPFETITETSSVTHLPRVGISEEVSSTKLCLLHSSPDVQPILYRALIVAKNNFFWFVRWLEGVSRKMYLFAGHMNDRLIFRDFVPFYKLSNSNTNNANQKALLDVSTWKLGISIGDDDSCDGGISGSMKVTKIENAGPTFKSLKVPVDAGACLSIDLLFSPESSAIDQDRCADHMKRFLAYHLEKELRSNRLCNGIKCIVATNENDDSRVLRIILSYKRLVSLDGWLEHMLIPYRVVPDLLSVLVIDFRSNIDIHELLSNKMTSLNDTFSASVDLTAGVRRNLIISLFERAYIALQAGITKAQAISRSLSTAASSPRDAEEEFIRRWRWQQMIPHFPMLLRVILFALRCLRCMKTSVTKFKFKSIGEFLQKINNFAGCKNCPDHQHIDNANAKFPSLRQVFQPGWLKNVYDGFFRQYNGEFNRLYFALKHYLEERKRKDDLRRKEELINSQSGEASKPHGSEPGMLNTVEGQQAQQKKTAKFEREITLERLKRLGVDTSENDGKDLFDADPEKPREFISSIGEESTKQDTQNLILLEQVRSQLVGLHSMELIMGKMKILANVQGFDVFELLPELPSMLRIQQMTMLKSETK